MSSQISRRAILAGSAIAVAAPLTQKSAAQSAPRASDTSPDVVLIDGAYEYEVNYTDEEWKARLSESEFQILREGGTEERKSSPLWKEKRTGFYNCKGCDLGVYSSEYKVILNKGWAFFQHSEPDSVLTGIDTYTNYGATKKKTVIEAHCRRCGSHFGHVLYIKGQILHCINGTSLTFTPTI